jgi:uncharacterized protein YidB (DUF937 family)
MPLPLLGIAAGGALLKGLGSFFGGRSKQKKEDAAAKETDRANRATFDQNEQGRQQALRSLLGSMGSRGIQLNTDPGALQTRQYTGADPTKVTQAGRGSGLAGALLGGLGDLGLGAAQSMQMDNLMSAGQPVGQRALGDAGSAFDPATLSAMAAEAGVSEDDVSNLIAEMLADRRG